MGNAVTLHSACAYGDLGALRNLLKTATQAELEAKDDAGRTPLLVAVANLKHKGHLHDDDDDDDEDEYGGALDMLIGSDDNESASGEEDEEAEAAVANEHEPEEVEELHEDAMIEPLAKEVEILHLLLQKHVNLDHQDENGWTALHYACSVQNPVAIRMLIHAGAHPTRESFGLLPQDLLQRGQASEWIAQAQELKELLDQLTDESLYAMKLLAFRPSGIIQLDMGAQVEKGSFVTIEYDVPENHSVKDYIQMLISEEDSTEIEIGSYHHVPAGAHGQITISTDAIPSSSTIRFVYVKCDINTISRKVVASGCNAVVQASVGEIFQYELYLYERVVEVESIPEFEFIDQPLIVLKRIGIVKGDEEIDWVSIRPDNHIVAVNDIRIDAMEFTEAVRVLQENNGKSCTKLLMQNYSACGDFIPEKILGLGVVGKYAYLHAVGEDQALVNEQQLGEWVRDSYSDGEQSASPAEASPTPSPTTMPPPPAPLVVELPATGFMDPSPLDPSVVDSKMDDATEENPASCLAYDDKISAPSTIEAVVPLHNSFELIEQLQHGISLSKAYG